MASLRLMHDNLRGLVESVRNAGDQLHASYDNLSKTPPEALSFPEDGSSTSSVTPAELKATNESLTDTLQSVSADVKALSALASQLQSSLTKFKL